MMKQLLRMFILLIPLVLLSAPCYPQAAGKYITRKPKLAQKKTTTPATPHVKKNTSQRPALHVMSEAEKASVIQRLVENMIYVEGGTFMMGATSEQGNEAESDESPAHRVTVSGFYIGKYEVTQREWEAVTGRKPSHFKGPNHPVEQVSWDDCQDFIAKLNRITGKHFRFPTEAEWEFAARGGNQSNGTKYSGEYYLDEVAWFDDNSGHQTHDVGTKRPNELGLYDMSGNVWEWCSDWYDSYGSDSQNNPTGSSSGAYRVLRGGCWDDYAIYCRISVRGYDAPDSSNDGRGLRLALL